MKSFVAFLFAVLVGSACFVEISAQSSDVEIESSEQNELLEKRAVFHTLKEDGEVDDDQATFDDLSDRQRKKVYYQQSALQRRFEGKEDANADQQASKRRLSSKKSSKKSNSDPYYFYYAPVGAAPVRPVSRPVAAPVTVNYNVPITAPNSPRLAAPVAVNINSAQRYYGSKGSKGSSKGYGASYSRYYAQQFVSNAPVAGPGFIYVEATASDCQAISNGGLVEGQRYMSDSSFTFGFNLVLNNGSTNIETVIATARAALQALVAQRIVNCNGYRRRLHQKRAKRHHHKNRHLTGQQRQLQGLEPNIVGNAQFNVESCEATTPCEVEGTCYTCQSTLDVALKGPAEESAIEEEINAILSGSDLVGESELGEIASTVTVEPVVHTQTTLPQIGGDPHIVTWKGEHYEYHGQCDLVMLNDQTFADGLGLDIHIRTKLVRFWSYIKNVSIRIGSDILEIVGNPDIKSRDPMYWVNYEYLGDLDQISGFPVTYSATSGSKSLYEIDLSSKYPNAKIQIKIYKEFLRVKMLGGAETWGNTVGLLGNYHTGETLGRDNVSVFDDYYKFGTEWQVNPSDPKLFHSLESPQYPEQCQLPDNPSGDRRRRLGEGGISEEQAEKACSTLKDPMQVKDCVYDILATQDLDMVGAF